MVTGLPDHIGLEAGRARAAILCGDPARAAWVAERVGAPLVSRRRGFDIYLAEAFELPLAVVATGIGGPATAIVAEELILQGVRLIVRFGSCGALSPAVRPGDLVVSSGCVREDGTSAAYLPASVPAAPDPGLADLLADAAAETAAAHGVRRHFGPTHCKDAYYAEKVGFLPDAEAARRRWAALRDAGALATEMEAAALFAVCQLRGIAAAALLIAVGRERGPAEEAGLQAGFEAATAAIARFARTGLIEARRPRLRDPGDSFLGAGPLGAAGAQAGDPGPETE